jgi:hypothetical protein
MISRPLILPCVVLVLNSIGSLSAQTSGLAPIQTSSLAPTQLSDGFHFTSPLSLSAGYDNNFVVGSQALNDTVILLTSPTLSWKKSTHRTDFEVDYEPEFEIFSQHTELNAWNHLAKMHFSHRFNARLTFDAGNSFLATMDPTRQLEDSLLLLPRGLFRQNLLYAGISYRLDRQTTVHFRFDNAITTMDLPKTLAGVLNQSSVAGTVSVDRTLNRHHFLTGSYSYLYIVPFQTTAQLNSLALNQPMHNVDVGYTYTPNPGLIIRLSGGVIRGPQFGYTAGGSVEKRLARVWLTGGFQRYLSFFGPLSPVAAGPSSAIPFAQGVLPGFVYQVASFGIRGNVTKHLSVNVAGLNARNDASVKNGNIRSWVARCRADYKLSGRLVAFTQLDFYDQNLNEFSPLPLSRRRYFGGLQVVLSRPREVIDVPGQSIDSPANSDVPETEASGTGQRDN